MRLIKRLGLAVVSALAAMAFVGVGTASADSLCEENLNHETKECANPLAEGTPILGLTVGKWTYLKGKFALKCQSSILALVGENEGSHEGLWALILALNFFNCEGGCNQGDGLKEPYLLLFDVLHLRALLSEHSFGGNPEILLTGCPMGTDCKYKWTALPVIFDVVEDKLMFKEKESWTLTSGSFLICATTVIVDATYLLTLEAPNEDVSVYLVSLP